MRPYSLGRTSVDLDQVGAIQAPGPKGQFEPPSFIVYVRGCQPFQFLAESESQKDLLELIQVYETLYTAWSGKEPPSKPKEKPNG